MCSSTSSLERQNSIEVLWASRDAIQWVWGTTHLTESPPTVGHSVARYLSVAKARVRYTMRQELWGRTRMTRTKNRSLSNRIFELAVKFFSHYQSIGDLVPFETENKRFGFRNNCSGKNFLTFLSAGFKGFDSKGTLWMLLKIFVGVNPPNLSSSTKLLLNNTAVSGFFTLITL